MECKQNNNFKKCNCTYEPCAKKGICCECINFHRRAGELPACYFSTETERTYDRSIKKFIREQGN